MKENRQYPRIALNIGVNCTNFIKSESYEGHSKNISQTGICITLNKALETGKHIDVNFELKSYGNIKAVSEIKWCKTINSNSYAVGLYFTDINDDDRIKIKNFIQDNNEPDGLHEKRKEKRIIVGLLIDFMSFEAQAKNISLTGLCIHCEELLKENKIAEIMFFLPSNICITENCKIIWREKISANLYEYGIQFENMKSKNIKILKKYIDEIDFIATD